jgi:hypothetical protein
MLAFTAHGWQNGLLARRRSSRTRARSVRFTRSLRDAGVDARHAAAPVYSGADPDPDAGRRSQCAGWRAAGTATAGRLAVAAEGSAAVESPRGDARRFDQRRRRRCSPGRSGAGSGARAGAHRGDAEGAVPGDAGAEVRAPDREQMRGDLVPLAQDRENRRRRAAQARTARPGCAGWCCPRGVQLADRGRSLEDRRGR